MAYYRDSPVRLVDVSTRVIPADGAAQGEVKRMTTLSPRRMGNKGLVLSELRLEQRDALLELGAVGVHLGRAADPCADVAHPVLRVLIDERRRVTVVGKVPYLAGPGVGRLRWAHHRPMIGGSQLPGDSFRIVTGSLDRK